MFCTFIFAVLLVKNVFLQLISYGDIWPQIFYSHDLYRLGSRDIQIATRVGCGGIRLAQFNSPSLKGHIRRKDLENICSRNQAIAHFVSDFVAMATRESQGKISLAAFDGPTLNPPIDAKFSQISLAESELQLILSQILLPWQPGRVKGKFE